MRCARFAATIASALCVAVMSACASGGRERHPTGSLAPASPRPGGSIVSGPVTDSAPYWCDLVSKDALTRVSGTMTELSEIRNLGANKNSSICGVLDKEKYGPLVVQWDVAGGRTEVTGRMKAAASGHPTPLPAKLGTGFSVYSQSASRLPYLITATFACVSRDAWIDIFVRSFSPGRDVTRDLTDLMRIAQRRFGEIHRCAPRPKAGS
jgi:hypothetical protein